MNKDTELLPCNGTPESIALNKILKALAVNDLNINSRGLFQDYIRNAANTRPNTPRSIKGVEENYQKFVDNIIGGGAVANVYGIADIYKTPAENVRCDGVNAQLDEVIELIENASAMDIDCESYINDALQRLQEMRGL